VEGKSERKSRRICLTDGLNRIVQKSGRGLGACDNRNFLRCFVCGDNACQGRKFF